MILLLKLVKIRVLQEAVEADVEVSLAALEALIAARLNTSILVRNAPVREG